MNRLDHAQSGQGDFFQEYPLGYHHVTQREWEEVKKSTIPPGITKTEDRLFREYPDDHEFRSQYFRCLPDYLAAFFANRYSKLYKSKSRRFANTWLRETMGDKILPRIELVNSRYKFISDEFEKDLTNLPTFDKEQVKDFSWRVSMFLTEQFQNYTDKYDTPAINDADIYKRTDETYLYLCESVEKLGITAPYKNYYDTTKKMPELRKLESGILRMLDASWLQRQFQRRRDMQKEHLAIAVGQVQKKASIYVSKNTKNEWLEQKKRNKEFFKAHELENEDGQRISLADMVYASVANPAIRRCELMVRMRGFENYADENGCVGGFFTITAPSKYHAVHNEGGFVKNWSGANPRDTQKYLCSTWAKIRASLKRQNINIFGFRVVEPHHDGTPHWHLLLFYLPEHQDEIVEIMRDYATEEDADELKSDKAKKARFDFKEIDKDKGSATGYIAKYISKNIDGYALDDEKDHDTGEPLKELAKATTAWASRWRIRQFQQIGGAPVTVYRECRRLGELELSNEAMDAVVASADAGDWAAYIHAQGGALVSRDDLVVRLSYEITPEGNQYGEDIRKIRGILDPIVGEASTVLTRLTKWKIVKKKEDVKSGQQTKTNQENQRESGDSQGFEVKKASLSGAWSSVNNCTKSKSKKSPEETDRSEIERKLIRIHLESRGEYASDENIDILQRGAWLSSGFGTMFKWKNGSLYEYKRHERYIK